MKSELWYLLEILEKYPNDKVLTVGDLKNMINESFEQASEDIDEVENSINPEY